MKNKGMGLYFMIFAILYFLFTVFMVGHGIHFTNSFLTIAIFLLGVYYYVKKEEK